MDSFDLFLFGKRTKCSLSIAILIATTLQTGCATRQFHSAPNNAVDLSELSTGKLAVFAIPQSPKIQVNEWSDGAANGAKAPFFACANVFKALTGGPEIAGIWDILVVAAYPICVVVGTPVTTVVGAVAAPSAKEVQAAKDHILSPVDGKSIQEVLRDKVVEHSLAIGHNLVIAPYPGIGDHIATTSPDYRYLAAMGIDTVLETTVTRVGLEGSGVTEQLLTSNFRARLIRTSDNSELYVNDTLQFRGGQMPISGWLSNDADQLRERLNVALDATAGIIVLSVFGYTGQPKVSGQPKVISQPGAADTFRALFFISVSTFNLEINRKFYLHWSIPR